MVLPHCICVGSASKEVGLVRGYVRGRYNEKGIRGVMTYLICAIPVLYLLKRGYGSS